MRKLIMLVVVGAFLLPVTATCQENQDTATAQFVLDLFQIPTVPIIITRLPQSEMQKWNKDRMVKECVGDFPPFHPDYQDIRSNCRARAEQAQFFLFGYMDSKDNTELKVVLDKNAGDEVVIHETLHFVLLFVTRPVGVVNNEQIVRMLTTSIIISKHYVDWLEERENG